MKTRSLSLLASVAVLTCSAATSETIAARDSGVPDGTPASPNRPSAAPDSARSDRADALLARAQEWSKRKPENTDAWVALGDAWMQKARNRETPGAYDRAEDAYRKALQLDANQVHAMLGLAWVRNTQHEFDSGIDWAKKVIDRDPSQPDAYALLGDAAVERGDYTSAYDHYQQCLDLRPDLSSYSRSAHLLFITGDVQRAQQLMRKAISAGGPYPENTAWCRARLARMLFDTGALMLAEKVASDGLKASPDNAHVLAISGKIHLAKKQFANAIRDLERSATLSAQHEVLADLEIACRLAGESGKASQVAARIRALHDASVPHDHGDGAHSHSHEGASAEWARYLADRDQDADVALAQAEAAYKEFKNVQVMDTLAWCLHKKGRNDEALRMIRKAMKWKTPDASILFHAGMIHASLGEIAPAQKYLYQALSLNPYFDPLHAETASSTLRDLAARQSAARSDRADASSSATRTPESTPTRILPN